MALLVLALFPATKTHAQPSPAATRSVVLKSDAATEASAVPLTKRAIRRAMVRGKEADRPKPTTPRRFSIPLAAGGLGGWLLGAAAGASIGHLLVDRQVSGQQEGPGTGALIGGVAGMSLGAPLGAHLANDRRGNYLLSALASAGIGVAGTALTAWSLQGLSYDTSPGAGGGALVTIIGGVLASIIIAAAGGVATAVSQVRASAAVERATTP